MADLMQNAKDKLLVIGATGGIGTRVAQQLRENGHSVYLAGRNLDKLKSLSGELSSRYMQITEGTFNEYETIGNAATEAMDGLTGVVCCSGTLLLKPAHLTSETDLTGMVNSHLIPAFGALRIAAKHLRANGGNVVLISSAASQIGLANHEAIAAMKGAINGLVLSASATYAKQRIRVNAVAPGLVETPMTSRITSSESALKMSLAMHPIGRIGTPSDISRAVCFLLHSENSWITGQILGVDGGLGGLKA